MRLRGTMTENQYKDMILAHDDVINDVSSKLNILLRENGYNVNNCYVLDWLPDEDYVFYKILVSENEVCSIEIAPEGYESILISIPIKDYIKKRSKTHRIRLAVALNLMKNKQSH